MALLLLRRHMRLIPSDLDASTLRTYAEDTVDEIEGRDQVL